MIHLVNTLSRVFVRQILVWVNCFCNALSNTCRNLFSLDILNLLFKYGIWNRHIKLTSSYCWRLLPVKFRSLQTRLKSKLVIPFLLDRIFNINFWKDISWTVMVYLSGLNFYVDHFFWVQLLMVTTWIWSIFGNTHVLNKS